MCLSPFSSDSVVPFQENCPQNQQRPLWPCVTPSHTTEARSTGPSVTCLLAEHMHPFLYPIFWEGQFYLAPALPPELYKLPWPGRSLPIALPPNSQEGTLSLFLSQQTETTKRPHLWGLSRLGQGWGGKQVLPCGELLSINKGCLE